MEETRLTIKEVKDKLMTEDKMAVMDKIEDSYIVFQCLKALTVVEEIQKVLLKENTCPEEDCDAIWGIMNEAYPYWYADD